LLRYEWKDLFLINHVHCGAYPSLLTLTPRCTLTKYPAKSGNLEPIVNTREVSFRNENTTYTRLD